eukprot:4443971-Pleurochrysis_carterae.AAC.1
MERAREPACNICASTDVSKPKPTSQIFVLYARRSQYLGFQDSYADQKKLPSLATFFEKWKR